MGAKLAHPEKLCINFWGEAAIGMTGMDFETCVRCQIPIMSILSNNFGMKMEFAAMKLSQRSTAPRHLRQLRRLREGDGRLRRARHRARPDRPCARQWHPGDAGRQAGAAGVHHHAGPASLERWQG